MYNHEINFFNATGPVDTKKKKKHNNSEIMRIPAKIPLKFVELPRNKNLIRIY